MLGGYLVPHEVPVLQVAQHKGARHVVLGHHSLMNHPFKINDKHKNNFFVWLLLEKSQKNSSEIHTWMIHFLIATSPSS